MNNINLALYFRNSTIKYTPEELLKIKEWQTEEEEDDESQKTLVFIKDEAEVVFTYITSSRPDAISIKRYVKNKLHGETATVERSNTHLANYENDIIVGEETVFFNHSDLEPSKIIHFGQARFEETSNNANVVINIINSKRFGRFVENYKDAYKDCVQGTYVNNQYHGVIKTYRKNSDKLGKLKKVESYVYGTLHGPTELYHENGNLSVKCTFVFGQLYGKVSEYNNSGLMTSVNYQLFDVTVPEKEFNDYDKKYGKYLKKINSHL